MPAFLLKAAAAALTLLSAAGSALYVSGHIKNPNAPLHPQVLGVSAAQGGRLTLTPSVRSADVEAITSTYAS
jgi:hypothetical protein